LTFTLRRQGEPDLHFRSHAAASRWAWENGLVDGAYSIVAGGNGGCCG